MSYEVIIQTVNRKVAVRWVGDWGGGGRMEEGCLPAHFPHTFIYAPFNIVFHYKFKFFIMIVS